MTSPLARRSIVALALGITVVAGVASQALASTVVRKSNADLAREAEVIVLGRVASQVSRGGPGVMIVTDVTLDVTAWVKSGDTTAKTFTFTTMGGTLDGRTFTFSGNTKYTDGEEVLLFLGQPEPRTGCRSAIGVAQGKFTVQVEEGTGKKFLVRDLGGLRFVDAHGRLEEPSKATEQKIYLEPFLEEIKGYLSKK